MQGPLKKFQCAWILLPNRKEGDVYLPAEYCGEMKDRKAKNRFRPDEETQYESFCPRHMYEFIEARKAKAHRIEDDDIDFNA